MLLRALLLASLTLSAPGFAAAGEKDKSPITWKKTVVDTAFRSEGVAVADVNKDGKRDILVGDVWYEAPDWKMHWIRQERKFNPLNYSECFGCFAEDFNGDGWVDMLVIPFPGKVCPWYENPQGKPGPWKEHIVCENACNETPQYLDLFGTGKRVLFMGIQPSGKDNMGQMCWFRPGSDPNLPWEKMPISEPSQPGKEIPGTKRYSHGLGAGDVNGDGRLDVLCTGGWWEQPEKAGMEPWKFHPAGLGPNCADMFALDMDGDGKNDVLSSSAHEYGIWWHKHKPQEKGEPQFQRYDIFPKLFSQSHAMHLIDINGDGTKDLVTGRRWWAHGPKGDPGSGDPAYLYWFEGRKRQDKSIDFIPHQVDDDSGIGTQFAVEDINGDGIPDIIISNKRGVFVFVQVRASGKQE